MLSDDGSVKQTPPAMRRLDPRPPRASIPVTEEHSSAQARRAVVVVPCYNESRRLPVSDFQQFLERPGAELLFVDDGSADNTAEVLSRICAAHEGRARLLVCGRNGGKAEAGLPRLA